MNSSCSSCYVLVDWLFLSYSDASHAENVNNADTLCNFYWKLSGDLTKGSYSQRGKIVFIYLTIFLEKNSHKLHCDKDCVFGVSDDLFLLV